MNKSKFTVAVLARSLYDITGGGRRRMEIANRLARRDWNVTMYNFDDRGFSPRWQPLKLEVPLKKRTDGIEADFVICGDLFEDELESKEGTFLTAKAKIKKLWLMQIYTRDQDVVLGNHHIAKVANSTHTKNFLKERFGQEAHPAIGGVDTRFFHPRPEPKLFTLLTYRQKSRVSGIEKLQNLREIDESPNQEDLRQRYWNSKIFVSLEYADYYGWCNPVAEAMACGRPCVAVESGHVRDLIIEGQTGFLAKPKLEDIQSRIDQLRDAKLRKRLIHNGLQHIKQFDWERVIDQIEKMLM